MHILFNMWALWVIGPALERWLGRTRFIVLYALGGLGGSVLVYLLTPINVPTLGASGAIFALFGATFMLARRLNFDVRWIIGLIVINLVITFIVPSISWQGHIGGLLTGAALGAVFAYAPRSNRVVIQTVFSSPYWRCSRPWCGGEPRASSRCSSSGGYGLGGAPQRFLRSSSGWRMPVMSFLVSG